MHKSIKKTINNTFLQLLSDLNTKDNLNNFFTDFLDKTEYEELIKRLAVIYWLRKKRPEDVIKANLGVTDKYINSIKLKMHLPGTKLAIKYLEAEEFANVWRSKIRNFKKF